MAKAHVVFTGGTIGSRGTQNVSLSDAPPFALIEQAKNSHPDWEISVSEPFRILSENADPTHWEKLAYHIRSLPLHEYDAVIVAHGSDTLPWTSSALSFALAGIAIPVVLIGANFPLEIEGSNGFRNFNAALNFCQWERLPGVFVAWGNPDEPVMIHLGTRLQAADNLTDLFHSAMNLSFGTMYPDRFSRIPHRLNPSRSALFGNANPIRWKAASRYLETGKSIFSKRLLTLHSSPGLDFSTFPVENHHWDCVLLYPYHSGTTMMNGDHSSFLDFIKRAKGSHTEVVIGPIKTQSPQYESFLPLLNSGIHIVPAMTLPSAETLLRFLMGTQGNLAGLDANLQLEQLVDLELN